MQRRGRYKARLRELVFHLERQVDAVVLDVVPTSLAYESLDAFALSLPRVSRTLIDIDIRVLSRLMIAFSRQERCLRLLRVQPDLG